MQALEVFDRLLVSTSYGRGSATFYEKKNLKLIKKSLKILITKSPNKNSALYIL